eukprot:scaffold5829_cov21-Prasinocladus_malaysianus.AAC.1
MRFIQGSSDMAVIEMSVGVSNFVQSLAMWIVACDVHASCWKWPFTNEKRPCHAHQSSLRFVFDDKDTACAGLCNKKSLLLPVSTTRAMTRGSSNIIYCHQWYMPDMCRPLLTSAATVAMALRISSN